MVVPSLTRLATIQLNAVGGLAPDEELTVAALHVQSAVV